MDAEREARVELWWLPVGAGGTIVAHTSRWWEQLRAYRERRPPRQLLHAALELFTGDQRYVIEMMPQWGQPPEASGVVATGPVGLRMLGRFRMFRYQARAWPQGILPDREYAVAAPTVIPLSPAQARTLLDTLHTLPIHTWGRSLAPSGDMWNSNSLVAWILCQVGIDATTITPPVGGDAPGWAAGVVAATLHRQSDAVGRRV